MLLRQCLEKQPWISCQSEPGDEEGITRKVPRHLSWKVLFPRSNKSNGGIREMTEIISYPMPPLCSYRAVPLAITSSRLILVIQRMFLQWFPQETTSHANRCHHWLPLLAVKLCLSYLPAWSFLFSQPPYASVFQLFDLNDVYKFPYFPLQKALDFGYCEHKCDNDWWWKTWDPHSNQADGDSPEMLISPITDLQLLNVIIVDVSTRETETWTLKDRN